MPSRWRVTGRETAPRATPTASEYEWKIHCCFFLEGVHDLVFTYDCLKEGFQSLVRPSEGKDGEAPRGGSLEAFRIWCGDKLATQSGRCVFSNLFGKPWARDKLIEQLNLGNLNKTLMKFSEDTSTGIDLVTFKAIKALPPCAKAVSYTHLTLPTKRRV